MSMWWSHAEPVRPAGFETALDPARTADLSVCVFLLRVALDKGTARHVMLRLLVQFIWSQVEFSGFRTERASKHQTPRTPWVTSTIIRSPEHRE